MIRLKSAFAALMLAVLSAPLSPLASGAGAADADDAYLEKLLGKWDMTGTMGSQALHYHAIGERVLQGGFLRLHMIDAAPHPQYEADVFIGVDPEQHDFIIHWLDRFGAAGARVVGAGKRSDARLIVVFPYASGNFRDTFTFLPDNDTWSLLLESQKPDGSWSTFATYTLVRAH
jgi:Protein of unknown function (DUF1579)